MSKSVAARERTQQMKLVAVDEKFSSLIETHRKTDGGFQRPLQGGRLQEISEHMKNGGFIPPITVANIKGRYILIDGQHRLEAWRLRHYPLMANVSDFSSEGEAADAFVDINAEAKRVSLLHVLGVSSGEYATTVREMAVKFDVSIRVVHNLIGGILNKQNAIKMPITIAQWDLARKVLVTWTIQKRWGMPNNVFANAGILRLVGYFTARASNPESMLKDMLTLDYGRQSPLGRMSGTSFNSQKEMRQFVYETIAKKVI